ncbi:S4 domain-containing protein [Pasteuria penetrans]|uniref:S4 domain-containing protein n=1 Tax=Pasteuria penetrans TaxID=86005 RepID=UPI0011EC9B8B
MRVDLFLKVSRLIKRRGVAKEACEQKRVWVNGRPVKPGAELSLGDTIELHLGRRRVTVKVVRFSKVVRKEEASSLYQLVAEEYSSAVGGKTGDFGVQNSPIGNDDGWMEGGGRRR